jgi:hypothetical protein
MQSQIALIGEMQAERSVQVVRTRDKFHVAVQASERDFTESASRILAVVEDGLTAKAAFAARKEDTRIPKNLDYRLYQELVASAGGRWQQMAHILEDDFKRFENYMSHHWKGELYLSDLHSKDDGEPASLEARRRFMAKVDSTLRRFVLGLKIDESLAGGLARSQVLARRLPIAVVVLSLVVAGAFYGFGWQTGAASAAASVVMLVGMFAMLKNRLRATRDHLADHFDEVRSVLSQMLADQVRDETDNAFEVFSRILEPSRQDMEMATNRRREQAGRLFELRQSLQNLAAELQGSAGSV